MVFEPPCTERYARWCERSTAQIMSSLLLDFKFKCSLYNDNLFKVFRANKKAAITHA